jgi:hypothetical protein
VPVSGVADAVRRLSRWIEDNAEELADHVLDRIRSEVPDQSAITDPALVHVERTGALANLKEVAAGLAAGRTVPEQLPPGAIEQALTMANRNVAWITLFRRYTFGHAELWDRILEEVDDWELTARERTALLQLMSRYLFTYRDYMAMELTTIYQAQRERLVRSREHRRVGFVHELLDGVTASEEELGYRLGAHHVGMVAWGAQPEAAVTALAETIGGQLLFVAGAGRSLWAWCGCSAPVDPATLRVLSAGDLPTATAVALGASAPGIEGFGRSHREAMQGFHVAVLHGRRLTRYEDVALEALALNDERLAREFAQSELGPLAAMDSRTALLRKTLRIYFLAGQNRAAAAARLSVHERTVGYRLGQVEQLLGHPITERPQELGVALRIHALLDGGAAANAAGKP